MAVGVTGLGNQERCLVGNGAVLKFEYILLGRISGITFYIFKEETDGKKIRCGFCVGRSQVCQRDLLVSRRPANLGHLLGTAWEKIGRPGGKQVALEVHPPC